MIRAFIAIELKEKETLEKIQSFSIRLQQNQPKLKLVEPENLHMTVKFLGDISESIAPEIYKLLNEEINEKIFEGKTLNYFLKGAGQFNRFSVIWLKLIGDIPFLQKVKNEVETLLDEKLRIARDKRREFKPHLTIGRLKKDKINYKNFDIFQKLINENKNVEFGPFLVKEIKLKKSVLTPKGPIYSDLVY